MWSRQLMNLVYLFLVGIIHFLMWLIGGTVTCTDNKYVWIWKNMGICIRPGTAMRSLYVLWLYCRHACRLYDNFCMTTLGIARCARPKPSIMCTLLLSLWLYQGSAWSRVTGGGGEVYNNDDSGDSPLHCLHGPIMCTLLMLVLYIWCSRWHFAPQSSKSPVKHCVYN